MDSPFPGMDPYLERYWGDVHQALITYARDQIEPHLPRDLRARMQQRLLIGGNEFGTLRAIFPDFNVAETPRRGPGGGGAAVAVAEAVEPGQRADEPLVFLVDAFPAQAFIEIVEAGTGDRVITVIEVLSPSNKRPGRDRDAYEAKRDALAEGGVNLVEIDLLRGGDRRIGHELIDVPERARTTYAACVHRPARPTAFEWYRAPLREPLPRVGVPLRPGEPDVVLDLQALIGPCYRNGRYALGIDYKAEPDPPLPPDDAAWADALLRAAGRR